MKMSKIEVIENIAKPNVIVAEPKPEIKIISDTSQQKLNISNQIKVPATPTITVPPPATKNDEDSIVTPDYIQQSEFSHRKRKLNYASY